jgi:hypothetical protein
MVRAVVCPIPNIVTESEMPQDFTEGAAPTTLHFRFPPPAVGGAQKTGWEALDKWVGGGGGAAPAAAAAAPSGKTGWEALDKWVGGGGGNNGGEGKSAAVESASVAPAAEAPVPAPAAAAKGGGGFLGALKRLFGG